MFLHSTSGRKPIRTMDCARGNGLIGVRCRAKRFQEMHGSSAVSVVICELNDDPG